MMNDMETEVEMLRRHRAEAWGLCGEAVGDSLSFLFLSSVMTLCFMGVWMVGPQVWIGLIAMSSWIVATFVGVFLKSHFSKKYMRLANGE